MSQGDAWIRSVTRGRTTQNMNIDEMARGLFDTVAADDVVLAAFSVEAAAFRAHKSDYIESRPRPLS